MSKTGADPGGLITSLIIDMSSLVLSPKSRLVVDMDLSLILLVETSCVLTISSLSLRSSPRILTGRTSLSLAACACAH